jgi:hypothetical protein
VTKSLLTPEKKRKEEHMDFLILMAVHTAIRVIKNVLFIDGDE